MLSPALLNVSPYSASYLQGETVKGPFCLPLALISRVVPTEPAKLTPCGIRKPHINTYN